MVSLCIIVSFVTFFSSLIIIIIIIFVFSPFPRYFRTLDSRIGRARSLLNSSNRPSLPFPPSSTQFLAFQRFTFTEERDRSRLFYIRYNHNVITLSVATRPKIAHAYDQTRTPSLALRPIDSSQLIHTNARRPLETRPAFLAATLYITHYTFTFIDSGGSQVENIVI